MSTPADWPMYVDADGQYGSADETREFRFDALSEEQWDLARALDGNDRFRYISAVLDYDLSELEFFEGEDA